jgi:GNAT superfamily N-acetyltransferase
VPSELIDFRDAQVDAGPCGELAQAMRDEIAVMYGRLELAGDDMPRAGPKQRGRGMARALLHALEAKARELGYSVARLDTGPKQVHARGLYESEGYAEIEHFNGNPVAVFWGEKEL